VTLISMLGGVSISQLSHAIYDGMESNDKDKDIDRQTCEIIRALPNVAARVRQSMTVLAAETMNPGLEISKNQTVDRLFQLLGKVTWVPEQSMNTAGALCASSLAFYASVIESMAKGASGAEIGGGLEFTTALEISAFAVKGVSALIAAGRSPEQIREAVISPGGSTWKGMRKLEEERVCEGIEDTIRITAVAASGLGKD